MSVNEVTLLKFIGARANALVSSLASYRKQGAFEGSDDVCHPSDSEAHDDPSGRFKAFVAELSNHYGRPSAVYAARYIDNHSVGNDNIWRMDEMIRRLDGGFKTRVVGDNAYTLWLIEPPPAASAAVLSRLSRRAAVRREWNLRMLLLNLVEAVDAYRGFECNSAILVIVRLIGATWPDGDVLEASTFGDASADL